MHRYHTPPYTTLISAARPRGRALVVAPSATLAVSLILLLALALRLWGVTFGLPLVIQPDEPSVEDRALQMWLKGTLNPHYFTYPSLVYDLQAAWAWGVGHLVGLAIPDLLRHPLLHRPVYYLAGRVLTALLGVATVYVTYRLGRLMSVRLGLIAALFLAVAPQHVQQSHYITVDAPTALFTALAALFAGLSVRPEGTTRQVVLAGVCAGLACGTKYNAGLALAMPLVAVALHVGWSGRRRLCTAAAVLGAGLLAFLVTTPYAVLRTADVVRDLGTIARHYTVGHPGAEGSNNAVWYLLYLGRDGVLAPITLLALLGLTLVVLRHQRVGLVLLAFTVPYYLLLSSTYVRFDRNLLPLLPFVAVLGALAVEEIIPPLVALLRNRAAPYLLVVGGAALPAAYLSAQADVALTRPFSEQVAVAWATTHLPKGAPLATENWEGLSFTDPPFHIVVHLGALGWQPYAVLLRAGVRYAVTDSYTDDAYLSSPLRYAAYVANYRALYRRAERLACIQGDPLLRPGPTMCLYRLRP